MGRFLNLSVKQESTVTAYSATYGAMQVTPSEVNETCIYSAGIDSDSLSVYFCLFSREWYRTRIVVVQELIVPTCTVCVYEIKVNFGFEVRYIAKLA